MIRRPAFAAALTLAAALALTGCAPPAAPTAWQQNVQTIAEQASTGDYASALASLDALEAQVASRRDAGEITPEEADGILTRIATVRADLTGLVPTPTPEPAQTTEPAPDDQQDVVDDTGGNENAGNGNGGNGGGGGPSDKKPGEDKGPGNGKGSGKKDG
ncbi:hypothetical protein SAMN04487848_1458 [Microbacterium sp. ru370.1]|uniref:hypothetical protein n=1 Tax=unclassified Microbacterium TaxID=2609290 RepID=UPI00087F3660|nr:MULTISPECIES: hypothetical protein [unclassified Microbacterium]SDO55566.1 hypothetical protein SAMN04487848_1458 [Microbacterium sp. ru370.1]SIT84984.1 hypothetical protein SAMN05880579_1455 [Microbacterium sp. RU1D]